MVDFPTFGVNIFLLIGLLLAAGLLILLLVAGWTGLNIGLWHWRRRQSEEAEHRRRFRSDGRPYPPAARGICGRCARTCESVYHLPDGVRLCPECYDAQGM
jgi:hypothetical protein